MRTARIILAAAAMLLLGAAPGDTEDEPKLNDKWQIVSVTWFGKESKTVHRGVIWEFQPGNQFVMRFPGGRTEAGRYQLDTTTMPWSIDVEMDEEFPYGPRPGILAIEGDRLRLCVAGGPTRPGKFVSAKNSSDTLYVMARVRYFADQVAAERPWRELPLIRDGIVDPAWRQIGWGGFVVHEGALRTECDERGMGLLLYTKEKFGDCQIRVVYRVQDARSNAGVYVRLDDGVLERIGEKSPAVDRDEQGKLSPEMLEKLMEASEKQLGAWYPVHHGYEVQICDTGDAYHRTGAIYSLAKAAPLPDQSSLWRIMIITLHGDRIEVEIDGKPVSTFNPASDEVPPARHWTEPKRDPPRPRHGYVGLQNHDPGDVVEFHEIAVRPLPETK